VGNAEAIAGLADTKRSGAAIPSGKRSSSCERTGHDARRCHFSHHALAWPTHSARSLETGEPPTKWINDNGCGSHEGGLDAPQT
jgi:hypothetical protein